MGYRNKTYVIFDGDNDMWAYRFMRGWNAQDHMDFDFYDAHDIRPLTLPRRQFQGGTKGVFRSGMIAQVSVVYPQSVEQTPPFRRRGRHAAIKIGEPPFDVTGMKADRGGHFIQGTVTGKAGHRIFEQGQRPLRLPRPGVEPGQFGIEQITLRMVPQRALQQSQRIALPAGPVQ